MKTSERIFENQKICFIAAYRTLYTLGGSEYQTYLIAQNLKKTGAKIYYISPYKENMKFIDNDIYVYCYKKKLKSKFFGSTYIFEMRSCLRLLELIKPDIIFQRGLSSLSFICEKYGRMHSLPYIYSASSDYDLLNISTKSALRYPFYKIETFFGRKAIKKASFVIVQSHKQLFFLKRFFNRYGVIVRNIIENEIDLQPKKKNSQILCYCKYNKNKSPRLCVDIAKMLPNRKFLIAGIENDRNYFMKYNKLKYFPKNIHLVGILQRREFLNLMADSRIYLSTSLFEGFPNTFIEAWTNKTAVISLFVNSDNLLEGEGYGYFVKGDINLAAAKIENLLNYDNEYESVTEASYRFAKREFDPKINMNKIKNIFLTLLSSKESS